MTKMEMLTQNYVESKDTLVKACEDSRNEVLTLLGGDTVTPVSAEAWQKVVSEPYAYNINSIELTSVTKFDGEEDWREQFVLTFEDDKMVFIYVKIK